MSREVSSRGDMDSSASFTFAWLENNNKSIRSSQNQAGFTLASVSVCSFLLGFAFFVPVFPLSASSESDVDITRCGARGLRRVGHRVQVHRFSSDNATNPGPGGVLHRRHDVLGQRAAERVGGGDGRAPRCALTPRLHSRCPCRRTKDQSSFLKCRVWEAFLPQAAGRMMKKDCFILNSIFDELQLTTDLSNKSFSSLELWRLRCRDSLITRELCFLASLWLHVWEVVCT